MNKINNWKCKHCKTINAFFYNTCSRCGKYGPPGALVISRPKPNIFPNGGVVKREASERKLEYATR